MMIFKYFKTKKMIKMKFTLLLLLLGNYVYSQTAEFVINPRLMAKQQQNYAMRLFSQSIQNQHADELISKNQSTLLNYTLSEQMQKNIYEAQKNVSSSFQNSQQVSYIIELANKCLIEFQELADDDLINNPEVILIKNKYINKYQTDVTALAFEITEEVMKVDETYLMDFRQRQVSLDRIERRMYQLYIRTKALNMMIRNYIRLGFMHEVTDFAGYTNQDKQLFETILNY